MQSPIALSNSDDHANTGNFLPIYPGNYRSQPCRYIAYVPAQTVSELITPVHGGNYDLSTKLNESRPEPLPPCGCEGGTQAISQEYPFHEPAASAASSQPLPYTPAPELSDEAANPALTNSSRNRRRGRNRSRNPSSLSFPSSKPKSIRPYTKNTTSKRPQTTSSHHKCDRNCLSGECSNHVKASLSSFLIPNRVGLINSEAPPPTPTPSTRCNLTAEAYEYLKAYFKSLKWFSESSKEPGVKPNDELIQRGFLAPEATSRLFAFINFDSVTGIYSCRIPHTIKKGGREIDCNHKVQKLKDVLAHVCELLDYKAHRCEGREEHLPCGKAFPTKERCNDHFYKSKAPGEDPLVCSNCGALILPRNHRRHHKKCETTVPRTVEPLPVQGRRRNRGLLCGCDKVQTTTAS